MLGISDLLNSDDSPRSLDELKLASKSPALLVDLLLMPKPASNHRVTKLLRSRIHPLLLRSSQLVNIALRRKHTLRKNGGMGTPHQEFSTSKLHLKLLEAGLRIRLILCPLMYELYRQLTPHTARKNLLMYVSFSDVDQTLTHSDILRVLKTHRGHKVNSFHSPEYDDLATPRSITSSDRSDRSDRLDRLSTPEGTTEDHPYLLYSGKCLSKRVRLIDSNLVNISRVSNKVLKSFAETPGSYSDQSSPDSPANGLVTTFNCLDTAVSSLYGIHSYSIVRVTRLALSSNDGSVLLKLETARPGDYSLIDDREFMDDMLASLGTRGTSPNNIFIKKVVARPRYKSDMKIYIVPSSKSTLLYVDERIFERDLINGVIDMDSPPQRSIFCTFPVDDVLARVRQMLVQSKDLSDVKCDPAENQMVGDFSVERNGMAHRSDFPVSQGSLGGSVLSASTLSLPSISSSTLTNSDNSSVSTPAYGDILYIPNPKLKQEDTDINLKFDTEYAA